MSSEQENCQLNLATWQRFRTLPRVLSGIDAPRASARERIQANGRGVSSRRLETVLLVAWLVVGGLYSSVTFSRFDRRFLDQPIGNDVWFEADMPVVADAILHRWGDHARNAHHPLFPLVTTVPAGMPSNPAVYAQPNPPQLFAG